MIRFYFTADIPGLPLLMAVRRHALALPGVPKCSRSAICLTDRVVSWRSRNLHSNNLVIGVIDLDGKRLGDEKLDCDLAQVERFLKPYKQRLQSMAVESTYNWYWLVDGLQAKGYPIDLRVGLQGARAEGNHNFEVLNERGPALKVFWPRNDSGWVQDRCACRLACRAPLE